MRGERSSLSLDPVPTLDHYRYVIFLDLPDAINGSPVSP